MSFHRRIASLVVPMEWQHFPETATGMNPAVRLPLRAQASRDARVRPACAKETLMTMFNKIVKEFQWGQHTVRMETGEVARQAGGAVIVDVEDTVVLATVVAARAESGPGLLPADRRLHRSDLRRGQDPGGFFGREGRPSENETPTSAWSTVRCARCSRKAATTCRW